MMIKKILQIALSAMVVTMLGCKVYQPVALPEIKTPAAFADSTGTDTTSIGDMPWKQLFTDEKLTTLIDSTLKNNRDLLRAVQRMEIARSRFVVSKGRLLPAVDANASAGFDKFGNYTQNGVGNFDTNFSTNIDEKRRIPYPVTPDFFVGLRSIWEIDLWGKLRNLKKAAYNRFLASERGVQLVKTSLVAEVASRYYELMALDNELNIIRNNIVLQDSALQIVQILKQAYRANELAVQQFKAQLLNTKALEFNTQQQITEVKNQLSYLQAAYPMQINRDSSILNSPMPAVVKAGVPSQLLRRRPDVQQAEFEFAANDQELQAAAKQLLPSLTLTPYLGLNSFKLPLIANGRSLTYGLMGGLTAPIIYQGIIKQGINIADATRRDAYYNYEQTVLNGVREVVNSLAEIENMRQVFELKQEEVKTLRAAVETSNLLYKTNYATYLEVITAQRNVLTAELELVNSRKQMFLAVVELYRALGGGWK